MRKTVSIHAPTRGATASVLVLPENVQVSIHAPTRGATTERYLQHPLRIVSIHAPTRGATRQNLEYYRIKKFQSTHPLGVRRRSCRIQHQGSKVSIHAPTRGATRASKSHTYQRSSFNPRTHSGCDIFCCDNYSVILLFQSTHPLGVRRSFLTMELTSCWFQSTHPLGVRQSI